jgi:serine phosphatase RsbU (regulator of sigma subunit)
VRLERQLLRIVDSLGRDLAADDAERRTLARELGGIIYGGLLAAAGLAWLVLATDLAVARAAWPLLLLLLLLAVLLNRLDFFWIVERRGGTYERWTAPLGGLVTASAMLLFGPTAIWLSVVATLADAVRDWRAAAVMTQRLNVIRGLMLYLSSSSLGSLLGLALYQRLGGTFPLPGLTAHTVPLAALAVLVVLGFDWLCWSCYLLIAGWTRPNRAGALELGLFAAFELVAYLPDFFAIVAAAVYVQMGIGAYLALIAGALLVSLLAHRLSQAVERGGQRSRELAQLEELGRALLAAPPAVSALPALLAASVPRMFRADQLEVRLLTGQALLVTPSDAQAPASVWVWLRDTGKPLAVDVGARPPWNPQPATRPLAVAPIVAADSGAVLGGISVRFSPAVRDPAEALPALQSLAAQVASALYRAEEYSRTLAHEKVVQELAMAAEIQASFLPAALPTPEGWQLAATLRPARQTSGDYYDVIELPRGCLGLVIADVTDKGTGAALYMALSRTLVRTYALEYPEQPEKALHAANKRLLLDSRSSMFVTLFYGVLDPASGTLRYANAGHNPPLHLPRGGEPRLLRNTGIPLGVMHGAAWTTESATIGPNELLVLYTDGVSEAQNARGELFDMARLLEAARAAPANDAQAVQGEILAAVDRFTGDAPQGDDITLLVVARLRGAGLSPGGGLNAEGILEEWAAGPRKESLPDLSRRGETPPNLP